MSVYIKKEVLRYRVPTKIILNKDTKFIVIFQ